MGSRVGPGKTIDLRFSQTAGKSSREALTSNKARTVVRLGLNGDQTLPEMGAGIGIPTRELSSLVWIAA
jgi:hypothetical protein